MGKRTVAFFCLYILLTLILTGWLMNVTFSEKYALAGSSQSSYTLTVYSGRGRIYDRNMNIIAGGASEEKAVILPDARLAAKLISVVGSNNMEGLEEKLRSGRPFIISAESWLPEDDGIEIIKCIKRYGESPLAPHVVGYLNGSGDGACGIEKAYNDTFRNFEGSYKITYRVNALGKSLGTERTVRDTTHNSKGGVVLTLDSQIQMIAQRAAEEYLKSGAVVIMDPKTGEILACVSTPSYDQNNISEYLESADSPLVNKAFGSYDAGSVFKLVVAAAALESGFGDYRYCCTGNIEIGNRVFKCSSIEGHGDIGFEEATALSCNTFFISLGQEMGYEKILNKARMLGFGYETELGRNYFTSKGNLPTEEELSLPAGLANFSFGQGSLMVNPIQIAALVSCIANDGEYVYPYIVKGTVNSGGEYISRWTPKRSYRAIDSEAAKEIRRYMESVMLYGTGKGVSAVGIRTAAKTGSAETGIRKNGRAVTRGWFAGCFPADAPEFVCVVLEEDAVSGSVSAGPCFRYLAERLSAIYGK